MARIVEQVYYDGARERIERLGLAPLLNEIITIVESLPLYILEKKGGNGGAAVRKMIDAQFAATGGWTNGVTSDLDWVKSKIVSDTRVCIAGEVQFSALSDLIIVDIVHLNAAFREGRIDVGVLLVPSDLLGNFLTDRGPRMSDAKRHVDAARLQDSPIIVLAVEHDGPGPALPKQPKRAQKP